MILIRIYYIYYHDICILLLLFSYNGIHVYMCPVIHGYCTPQCMHDWYCVHNAMPQEVDEGVGLELSMQLPGS